MPLIYLSMQNSYLEVLGLQSGATKSDIKSAYRRLSKIYHPDISKDPNAKEKFIEVNEAYKFLTDVGPQRTQPYSQSSYQATYDYNPYENAYETHRRKAKAYARKKAKEAARRQTELVKKILTSFDVLAYAIVAFNLILLIDNYLPPSTEYIKAKEIHTLTFRKSREAYTDVIFENVKFRLNPIIVKSVDFSMPATVYTSPIMNVPLSVEFENRKGETISANPSYSVYEMFWPIIELILGLFCVYRFVKLTLDNQLTWAIFLFCLAAFQLYIYLTF